MAARSYAGPAFIRTLGLGMVATRLYLVWAGLLFAAFTVLAALGVILNVLGLGVVNAYVGLIVLAAVAIVWFVPPAVLGVLIFGALRAQPGNTPGFSLADASKGAGEDWKKFKDLLHDVLFYLAVGFMFLSFIPLRNAPWMVGFILFAVLYFVLVSRYYGIPMRWAQPILRLTGFVAIIIGFAALFPPAAWHRFNLPHPSTLAFSRADDLAAEYSRVKFEREESDRAALLKSAIAKVKKGGKLTPEEEAAIEKRTVIGTAKPLVDKAKRLGDSKKQEKALTLSGNLSQAWKVCGIEPGKWKYDLVGNPTLLADTGYDIKLRGVPQSSDPVNYPRYRGFEKGPKYEWALLADGVAPGENLVVGSSGCVEMSLNLFSDVLVKTAAAGTQIKEPKEVQFVLEGTWF